jgi:CDP-diacylglycerol---serine O-phosphatidyltransferase
MKFKSYVPNISTFGNLSLGMLAIMFAFNDQFILASILILIACFMDRFDGKIARKFDVVSDLGKELDSLSDLISFGAAPALLAWKLNLINFGSMGYLVAVLFTIAGAYRLARFNSTQFFNGYMGMPITLAGGLLSLYNIYSVDKSVNIVITTIFMLLLSYLMVSKIKVPKL